MKAEATLAGHASDARRVHPLHRAIDALKRTPPVAVDIALVAMLIGFGLLEAGFPQRFVTRADQVAQVSVIVGAVLPLLWRRRFPFLALLAMAIVGSVAGSMGPTLSLSSGQAGYLALLVATFTVVATREAPLAWAASAISLSTLTLVLRPGWGGFPFAAWLPEYPPLIVSIVAGVAEKQRRGLARALEGRLLDMHVHRDRLNRLALQKARAGLARDLHDVVADSLQRMDDRAQEAMIQLNRSSGDPQPALAATETAGRTALSEMRRLLQVLRSDEDGQNHAPQPDLRGMQELVANAFPPPVQASLRVDGDVARVPPSAALAAYRIVQEALTNARRHSDPDQVEVRLQATDRELFLEVHDDGRPKKLDAATRMGLGILGMRERVALFGGTLEAGPRSGGGYSVVAHLPLVGTQEGQEDGEGLELDPLAVRPVVQPPRQNTFVLPGIPAAIRRLAQKGWPVDVLLVVVLSAGVLLEFRYWSRAIPVAHPAVFSPQAWLWAVAWVFLLLFRRKVPVLTGVAMAGMAFFQTYPFFYWTPSYDLWALQIAVYTIGSMKPGRPHGWVVAALGAVGIWSIQPLPQSLIGFLALETLKLGAAAYVGTIVGERRRLIAQLEESMRSLTEERRTELALALHQDRRAIAREMHDLGAHTLSLMVVQAGAARTVAPTDPEAARSAIRAVRQAGHEATRELHQLLSLLRTERTEESGPSVGRDVEALVSQARQSGFVVEFHRTGGPPPPVGSTVEAFQYRIVQEALTNVRKHAPGSAVKVLLEHDVGAVLIRVENDGAAAPARHLTTAGAGHGLLGMRERVAIVGGRLQAGPTPDGGFVVEAVMPREAAAA